MVRSGRSIGRITKTLLTRTVKPRDFSRVFTSGLPWRKQTAARLDQFGATGAIAAGAAAAATGGAETAAPSGKPA